MSEGWDASARPGDMRGTRCDFVAKGAKRCSAIWHAAAGPQSPRENLRAVGHAKV